MIRWLAVLLCLAGPVMAQDFGALARVDPVNSRIADADDGLVVDLSLTQAVPYRVYTLDAPRRLVVEFRTIDWTGLLPEDLLQPGLALGARFGEPRADWTSLTVDLAAPLALTEAGLRVDPQTGQGRLTVRMAPTDAERFAMSTGGPSVPVLPAPTITAPVQVTGPPIIVIDPGHGGVDPGALRGGVKEADLMLALAIELAEAIDRTGTLQAVLTRNSDVFVPLEARMTIARAAGATALVSLHADALDEGGARGASVYTLNKDGVDRAAQRMAERHERSDLLSGLDLTGQDDRVATVLMDLARAQTQPASTALADAIVTGLRQSGARVNSRPRRDGRLAVLNAADFASVLVEVGFLSDDRDRANLSTAQGRAPIVAGLASAIASWADAQAAIAPLRRR
ncbi:N-acetylmuramoyl-L-alanine amidase [Loktanella sp. SALINAS62]|uniref:N-acetylmuramoyl-L-alanine amidase n=1 Tax=Loktanella sp. SALINAS62 TaxID=2706124 RepID=UPI001B8B6BAB|nr:N-acetylmuramoyl-L-alanine amidase [Loktanella sp. SALINAS62]MBS1301608.1 N-acetylmuramoyl-L-alanine amidase [Loktanella sp. SALINAS62]